MALTVQVTKGSLGDFDNGFSEPLSSGIYPATLIALNDAEKNKFNSDEMEPAIEFVFEVAFDGDDNVTVKKIVTPKIGTKPKSALDKMLPAIMGQEAYDKLVADPKDSIKVLESLKGKKVQLQVSLNTSDRGTQYSKLENILPADGGKGGKVKKAEAKEAKIGNEDFDNDQIPF